MAFDVDELVAELIAASAERQPLLATRDILERVIDRSDDVAATFAPRAGGFQLLYNTDDLTVLNIVWAPGMYLIPHEHLMWAAIAPYTGAEDNTFFRRAPGDETHLLEAGGRTLDTGDVLLLGDDAIHSVRNSRDALTGAIHVYGGDFVRKPRSQWGPGPMEERPYDFDFVTQEFEAANKRAGLT